MFSSKRNKSEMKDQDVLNDNSEWILDNWVGGWVIVYLFIYFFVFSNNLEVSLQMI